jgi:uncharacterized protein (DUF427 family)
VRATLGHDTVVDSTRAVLLWEPRRVVPSYAVPRDDVRADLQATATRSYCPYKGHASYWSAEIGGRRRDDLAWSYEQPLPDAIAIAGLVAFWDEQVDVFVDGHQRSRPGGPVADALRHEFGV